MLILSVIFQDKSIDYLDMGGAYVGKQQTALLALLKELDLETYNVQLGLKSTLSMKVLVSTIFFLRLTTCHEIEARMITISR